MGSIFSRFFLYGMRFSSFFHDERRERGGIRYRFHIKCLFFVIFFFFLLVLHTSAHLNTNSSRTLVNITESTRLNRFPDTPLISLFIALCVTFPIFPRSVFSRRKKNMVHPVFIVAIDRCFSLRAPPTLLRVCGGPNPTVAIFLCNKRCQKRAGVLIGRVPPLPLGINMNCQYFS